MTSRAVRDVAGLVLVVLAAGCGPRFGDVSGTVKYQGKPVSGGTITFFDAANKTASSLIAPDGSYAVKHVAAGQARITVVTPMPINFKGMSAGLQPVADGGAGPGPGPALPAKYGDPSQSGLTCDVRSTNQTHDVTLD
jgi:hypothetical protein